MFKISSLTDWRIWVLLFQFQFTLVFGGGYSSWRQETPGGNLFDNGGHSKSDLYCRRISKTTDQELILSGIREWYFYANSIVGIAFSTDTLKSKNGILYFIFNEKTCDISTFYNEEEWQLAVKKKSLRPTLWKRSYTDAWGYINTSDLAGGMMVSIFGPFIALGYLFLVVIVWMLKKSRLKRWGARFAWLLLALFIVRLLLDIFPGSI